jgi:hypothetical protein
MNNQPDNPFAFARPYSNDTSQCGSVYYEDAQEGMTLRDWFAGQALAGDMASQDNEEPGFWPNDAKPEDLAKRAALLYRIADAMLTARNNPPAP